MKRKAQITLMIAIAFFVILIAFLIIYAGNYFKSPGQPLVFERASIENYISNCVKKTSEESLIQFGKKGFNADSNKVPSVDEVQSQLASHIDGNLDTCLKDFEDFSKQGWDVEKGKINANAQVNERDVSFDVSYPLKISDDTNTISFERFASKSNIRLKYIHELISKIVDFKFKYGKEVDLTTLREYDLEVTIFPDKNDFVYVIDDHKSLIMGKPYRFKLVISE
jgi:hypothetical protein